MHPLNTDRFRFPRLTNKERSFIEAEARRDEVRADFRTMVESARDTGALLAALQRHLIAASAILDMLEVARVRALRSGRRN